MLLKDLVFEEENNNESISDFIEKNCKPFLNQMNIDADIFHEFPLYRGMFSSSLAHADVVYLKDEVGDNIKCYIKTVRKDRLPTDTHTQISELFDNLLKHKFGWKPRSEAVFCFGSAGGVASSGFGGGKSFLIVPIGDIKFVYSPTVKDATLSLRGIVRNHGLTNHSTNEYSDIELENISKDIENLVNGYVNENLMRAVEGPLREIMIKCDKYLVIPKNY